MSLFCRRVPGVQQPVSGVLGVYLFLPFGLSPPPGINDACVKSASEVIRTRCPRLQIADFAGDLRLADVCGEHDALAADMAGAMPLLDDMGTKYHTKEGKRCWMIWGLRQTPAAGR